MDEKPGFVIEEMEANESAAADGALPPADFSGFVVGLAQTAMIQLGEIPDPVTKRTAKNLDQARYTIDLLSLLEAKTRGNLTRDEDGLLRRLLSDLKLRYVRAS